VEGIRGIVFVVVGNNDTAGCEGFFDFRIAEFGDSEEGGNKYDAGEDESLRIDVEIDIGDKDGVGDNNEIEIYYLMEFGHCEMGDEGADEYGVFVLTDERGGGCDDGFGPGDAHRSEEENGELTDKSLEDAIIVQELDEGDEKNDGGDNGDEESV
jgi:hypothetical protein